MTNITLEQRCQRKVNIENAEKNNLAYKKRCRLHGYIAGKAIYHLDINEDKISDFPVQHHYQALKLMTESGVDMVELHADVEHKDYVKRFVELCHYFERKVIIHLLFQLPEAMGERKKQLEHIVELLDEYHFDGICHQLTGNNNCEIGLEQEDFHSIIYTEVKKRNGIYVLCCENDNEGETLFARMLPFVKFPSFRQEWSQNATYEQVSRSWKKYLMLYRPMVAENSVVYLELKESNEIVSSIPERVYVSMFVNEETYLIVSNLSDIEYKLTLREQWTELESGISGQEILVDSGDVILLVKSK